MAYPVWQSGTLYQPGDIVVPITAPSPTATSVENGEFTDGANNWDFTGSAFYSEHVSKGGWRTYVELPGNQAGGGALNQTKLVVPVGKKITAACLIDQGASVAGATRGWVEVHWFSASNVLLRIDKGNQVDSGAGGAVHRSTCEAICPEGAAYCRAGIELWSVADHNHAIWGGNLWVEGTFAGLPADLAYKAVQPESGFSDASEPAWPPVLGQQVVDNEVTWEAIAATRVVWTAEPLYISGETEPEWPEEEGGMVKDGTVTLRAVSRRVEDPNCPNTKIVAIAASKVFCGDDDIVRYSATVNPLDWSTDNDAGYLPTGLQNYGANPVTAMGLYRGNLIVFNAEAFQLWQVDEDPANMALLDALPMGSTQHHAIAPVSNDLFFLASQGVRTVGIAASSTNFQAGDVGMPVDPLVQEAAADADQPLGLYYPAMGQYWLAFSQAAPVPQVPTLVFYSDNVSLFFGNIINAPDWLTSPTDSVLISLTGRTDDLRSYYNQNDEGRFVCNLEVPVTSGSGTGIVIEREGSGETIVVNWVIRPARLNAVATSKFSDPIGASIVTTGNSNFVDHEGNPSQLLASASVLRVLAARENRGMRPGWDGGERGDVIPQSVTMELDRNYATPILGTRTSTGGETRWDISTSYFTSTTWAGLLEFTLDGKGPFYADAQAFARLLDADVPAPREFSVENTGGLVTSGAEPMFEWWSTATPSVLVFGIGALYELRVSMLEGSLDSSNITPDTWQSLSETRNGVLSPGARALLEIRDASTGLVRASSILTAE